MTIHQSLVTSHRSLRAVLRDGIVQLERAQVPSASLAAELLLMHALGRDRTWLYSHAEYELALSERERYLDLIARRASGVPTQHLTGHQEFWGLDFEVTPDVLIPRPETEHVIEVSIESLLARASACGVLPGWDRSPGDQPPQAEACATQRQTEFRIADVGTGSGCIAIALAHELPSAQIVATDISPAALEVARRNAARHGVAERIEFIEGNLLDCVLHLSRVTGQPGLSSGGLRASESRPFDLIASNPPYIARRDAATLPREVREHEPETALFGGETGTELYAPLITQTATLLKPGGILVVELGHDSAEAVSRLLCPPEWIGVTITNDLAGIPRVASAQRSA